MTNQPKMGVVALTWPTFARATLDLKNFTTAGWPKLSAIKKAFDVGALLIKPATVNNHWIWCYNVHICANNQQLSVCMIVHVAKCYQRQPVIVACSSHSASRSVYSLTVDWAWGSITQSISVSWHIYWNDKKTQINRQYVCNLYTLRHHMVITSYNFTVAFFIFKLLLSFSQLLFKHARLDF